MALTARRNFILAMALVAAGCATRNPLDPPPQAMSFDEFMALSKRLTAVDDLDAEVGKVYFANLPARDESAILEAWFSGVYPASGGPRVATYTGALAWTTLGFTKPPTFCGGAMGYWAQKP